MRRIPLDITFIDGMFKYNCGVSEDTIAADPIHFRYLINCKHVLKP